MELVPRLLHIPDVNSELGDSDLARDAPQTPALNANPGDNGLSRDASQTPASNASPDDSDPSRDTVDHRCISPLQRIPDSPENPDEASCRTSDSDTATTIHLEEEVRSGEGIDDNLSGNSSQLRI